MENVVIPNVRNTHTMAYYKDNLAPMRFRQDTGPAITGALFAKAFMTIKRYPGEKGVVETYIR